ncbi:MAG: AraC family transcriptional regulator [Alphaproteobacteria bacterium]|nr:AraC family transcriptional regulator [Alphaproteobacteria bacterium]
MEHFSTETVAERERFSYWREAVCDAYVHLGCEIEQPSGFQGEIKLRRYPNIAVSLVSGNAHDVYRRPQDIAQADEEYFLLSLQTSNAADITQHDRRAELKRGDCALYCSTDPYHLSLTGGFQQLVLQVRKADLLGRLPEAGQLTGMRIDCASQVGGSEAAQLADRTITELAMARGFENMQHFSKSFRDHFQMSPRDYRANKAN